MAAARSTAPSLSFVKIFYILISTGLTIIDSMDTLLLMGLTDELNEARKWVSQLDFR